MFMWVGSWKLAGLGKHGVTAKKIPPGLRIRCTSFKVEMNSLLLSRGSRDKCSKTSNMVTASK